MRQESLKSRRPLVPGARKSLGNASELDIRNGRTDFTWNMKYFNISCKLYDFIPRVGPRSLGLGLPWSAWVRFNRLQMALDVFGLPCINGVLLPLIIASVVRMNKLQTTSLLHALHTGHQKDVVVCPPG